MAQGGVPSWWWPNENYGLRVLDDGTLELVALNGVVALTIAPDGTLSGAGLQFHDIADPTLPLDVANKEYVDTHGGGGGGSGATGATGPVGPSGAPGPAGSQGATGATGPPGSNGGAGATGATGPPGTTGGQGATGSTGPVGSTGVAGATGATGPDWTGWSQDPSSPNAVTGTTPLALSPALDETSLTVNGFNDGDSDLLDINPTANGVAFNNIQVDKQGTIIGAGIQPNSDGSFFLGQWQGGPQASSEFVSQAVLFYQTNQAVLVDTWQANHFYYFSRTVRPTVENGHYYINFSGTPSGDGTSGGTEPTWPTNGSTVNDGTVTWIDGGLYKLAPAVAVFGASDMGTGFVPRSEILTVWQDNQGKPKAWSIGSYGEEILWVTDEPGDSDVATSSRAQTYDDAIGFPKLLFSQRDSAGTLFKGYAASFNVNNVFKQRNISALDAQGALGASQYTTWLDDTSGAPVLHIVARDSGSALYGAAIPLGAL